MNFSWKSHQKVKKNVGFSLFLRFAGKRTHSNGIRKREICSVISSRNRNRRCINIKSTFDSQKIVQLFLQFPGLHYYKYHKQWMFTMLRTKFEFGTFELGYKARGKIHRNRKNRKKDKSYSTFDFADQVDKLKKMIRIQKINRSGK